MMLISTILLASLILQCFVLYLVLRLIKVTGKSLAWRLIVVVISLMAFGIQPVTPIS